MTIHCKIARPERKAGPEMEMVRQQKTWAIDLDPKRDRFFMGRYFVLPGEPVRSNQHVLWVRLFETRAEALRVRKLLKNEKQGDWYPYPNARVVRVMVTVEVIPTLGTL